MNCRICGSQDIDNIGEVEYYSEFAWPVFDCNECGCRFTRHDESIYNTLHSNAGSCYNLYRGLLERYAKKFNNRDLDALRNDLCQTSKYKFIIDQIERGPHNARVLEVGCSRGYLTSYFILAGYQITGVDVSLEAIKAAREAFGNHFVLASDPSIATSAPYDVIYHVGTIGCVADPLAFTRRLLILLKPNGCLLFNSPNLQTCGLAGQLWIDTAPPPDLVSIFPPGFWKRQFANDALVEESIETYDSDRSLTICLRKLFRWRWKQPAPIPLNNSSDRYITGMNNYGNRHHRSIGNLVWLTFERGVSKFSRQTGFSRIVPAQPTDFGLFVKMTRLRDIAAPLEEVSAY